MASKMKDKMHPRTQQKFHITSNEVTAKETEREPREFNMTEQR